MDDLVLSTAADFETICENPDVVVKDSSTCGEYITAVYLNGVLVAERIISSIVEHFTLPKHCKINCECKAKKCKLP